MRNVQHETHTHTPQILIPQRGARNNTHVHMLARTCARSGRTVGACARALDMCASSKLRQLRTAKPYALH
eukprot:7957941-Alexandrium_andersonii.AAC.1